MYLVSLVYASTTSDQFQSSDVESILASARSHNSARAISGLLCFSNKYFLQCLEGSRAEVNETYLKILNDSRHKNIELLGFREISKRQFAGWSMGYVPKSSLGQELILRYSGSADFAPHQMSAESAHSLLARVSLTSPLLQT